jgi:hypothetical protein
MKEHINSWLTEKIKITGVLACGTRAPDRKTFTRSQSPQFSPAALENACRCMADTFHVLHANRFPEQLVRWVFQNYFVYGSMRPDGICLAVLARRESPTLEGADLEQMIGEFQSLRASNNDGQP